MLPRHVRGRSKIVMAQQQRRNANLDLLRAVAISAVAVFHVLYAWPAPLPSAVMEYAFLGAYGVDLFFVLSGWLIGGLYWAERSQFGNVETRRFWLRRWLRTIPPYWAGLALAYLGVYFLRREPFHWEYLIFLQNLDDHIPFFQVSWSLCVEEHFYLALPIVLFFVRGLRRTRHLFFLAASLMPVVLRFTAPANAFDLPFGHYKTATQFHCEGLVLGVWASCIYIEHPSIWPRLEQVCRWLFWPLAAILASIPYWNLEQVYRWSYSLTAVCFATCLVAIVRARPFRIATWAATFWIATTSYSVYLTHSLAIHLAALTCRKLPIPYVLWLPLWILLIAGVGYGFFRAFEETSIRLRDRWVPRRGKSPKAEPAVKLEAESSAELSLSATHSTSNTGAD